MPQDPCLILSPHLDDAVLSAWHVISAPRDVCVVTVFAGIPEPGFVTDLDRDHGAQDSAAWAARRRREDRAALAVAGRQPVHLDLPDIQFAAFAVPAIRALIASSPDRFLSRVTQEPGLGNDPDQLAAQLLAQVPRAPVVYGPAGIGGHPDHRDLAQATVRLATAGREVWLYADSPYYTRAGLPRWLPEGTEAGSAADESVNQALARLDRPGQRLVRHAHELDDAAFERKLAAIRRYETEYPAIIADLDRSPAGIGSLRHETYWKIEHAD